MKRGLLFLAAAAMFSVASQAAHGGKPKPGDGYFKPISSNGMFSYYSFEMEFKSTYTSTRFMPGSTDPGAPGTIITAMGEMFDVDSGARRGIAQWSRIIIGDDADLSAANGNRVVRGLVNVAYEFGSTEAGFFDDAISQTLVTKRDVTARGAEFADHDSPITGGAGRFLGAMGRTSVRSGGATEGDLTVTRIYARFDVYVPKLPKLLP